MADLSDTQAAGIVRLIGADTTGTEQYPVQSTNNGGLHVNLRNTTGTEITSTSISGSQAIDVNDVSIRYPHINRIDASSAAQTATGNTVALDSLGFGSLTFLLNITAVSGTSPTMQLALDYSEDGTVWSQILKTVRFTSSTNFRFQRISLSAKYYRYRWILAGTAPSFTFSVTTTLKAYQPPRNTVISEYSDLNLASVGATSTIFTAADSRNISIMTIRAADGGNNGQFRVQSSNDSFNWADTSGNITQGVGTTILTAFANQSFRYYRLITQSATNAGTRVLDIHWGVS